MNTATVDMRTSIDAVADAWSDTIGTPYLIKLNPNMLPVAMTAVDYEGKDRGEISSFVSDELINKLEGVDGVASVSKKGLLTERENIVLSQKKLDKLNKKITAALDSKFADAEDKIKEARSELDKNVAAAEDGAGVISSSLDEISNQQAQLGEQLADAQTQADDGKTKMLSAKMELLDQKATLAQTKQVLELSSNALLTIKAGYNDLLKTKAELSDRIDALTKLNDRYISALEELLSPETTPERRQELNDELEKIDRELEPYGIKKEGLAAAIAAANAALAQADSSIGELNQKLRDLGTDFDSIDNTINSLSEQIAQINSGIEQIDAAISGLDDQTLTVSQALATISQQQSNADFQMSSAVAALTAKQTEVTAAAAQLDAAQKELDSSLEQISEQKKTAADAADMDGKVTLDNVSGILMAQSFSMPAGYVSDDNGGRYLVRVGDEVRSEQALSDLVLFDTKIDSVGVVRLSDVADVFISDNSDEIYAKIDGNDGVILSFSKQSNIATSTVCNNLNAEMRELEEKYDGLKFRNLYSIQKSLQPGRLHSSHHRQRAPEPADGRGLGDNHTVPVPARHKAHGYRRVLDTRQRDFRDSHDVYQRHFAQHDLALGTRDRRRNARRQLGRRNREYLPPALKGNICTRCGGERSASGRGRDSRLDTDHDLRFRPDRLCTGTHAPALCRHGAHYRLFADRKPYHRADLGACDEPADAPQNPRHKAGRGKDASHLRAQPAVRAAPQGRFNHSGNRAALRQRTRGILPRLQLHARDERHRGLGERNALGQRDL